MEEGYTRRIYLPDVRGRERYLRVTWHRDSSTLVWSQWQGDRCVASTRVSLADSLPLAELILDALEGTAPPPLAAVRQERTAGS